MNDQNNQNAVQPHRKLRYHNYLFVCDRFPNKIDLANYISTVAKIEDILKDVKVHTYQGEKNYFIIKIFTHHPFVFDTLNFCIKHKCKFIRKGFKKDTDLKELLDIDYSPIESN